MNYTIYAESTPNPSVMKFVSNKILTHSSIEINSSENTNNFPIADAIFQMPFVKSIFINSNYIAITKTENVQWEEIAINVRNFISEYLNKNPIQTEDIPQKEPVSNMPQDEFLDPSTKISYTDEEIAISDILEEYIRPAVESDGGEITLHSFKNGIVTVNLSGACSGCPSSTITLKQGIESLLKQKIGDSIKEVVAK
ncbi:MAG: hypothetical protein CMP51_03110 [Flavobacteriales bacterium]|nr:hypothetical protein [Flavobacteriales bacterium]|tara:strand:+ start:2070 stop:2660 length:591 start_codon:yes stop_codon:yes gene_type:complete